MSVLPPNGGTFVSVRRKLFIFLTVALLLTALTFPSLLQRNTNVQAVSNTLVISQFQVAGDGSPTSDDEFIEIHNVSGSDIDLNGYRVVYRSAGGTNDVQVTSWSSPTMLAAGRYYLIGHTPAYNGPTADRAFDSSIAFSATGGGMAIRNGALNTGTIVDSVGFGSATNAFIEGTVTSAPSANNSMSRKSSGCQDTDNNASDFEFLTPSAPRNLGTTPNICSGTTPTATPRLVKVSDFDADNHADFAIWHPSTGEWSVSQSGDSTVHSQPWGAASSNDQLVPGDYDGDGAADLAVFRPSEGNWYIINSATNTITIRGWGISTDMPVPADYDGDGKTDLAVYRPSEGNWYIINSATNSGTVSNWGLSTDKPVPGDYDGDGHADIAVFRPTEGNWYIVQSTAGGKVVNWGNPSDTPVAGDYDGDGKLDPAVYRSSENNWYIIQSSNNAVVIRNWGLSTDVLVPADYDGDKKTDIAVWRPSEGNFYIINSAGSPAVTIRQYGSAGDIPVASAYKTFGSSDGVAVVPPPPPLTDDHLAMGNPSGAVTDTNVPNNYLMSKDQYALSYSRDKGEPNWVSWHLDPNWLGSAPRQNNYRADTTLPAGWYQVQGTDYSGSGFDRGHMCPSGDRTRSIPDNSATFLMTNFIPQASNNNQGPWNDLENYCRTLVSAGNELYIISGGAGQGGTGSNGFATTITNGHVVVPAQTWKVIIVLTQGSGNDAARVTTNTRTIAVIMPNSNTINPDWKTYRVSVDQVEALTGYDFFSNVPTNIQAVIEATVDNQ